MKDLAMIAIARRRASLMKEPGKFVIPFLGITGICLPEILIDL
jgi:hypothetical protein